MAALSDPTNYGNEPGLGPLRQGGVPGSDRVGEAKNLPSTLSKAAQAMRADLQLVRDIEAGQRRIKDQSTAYLPKAPGEEWDNYQDRLNRSVFFNAFMQTIHGLTGMIFRRNPKVDDKAPEQFKRDWENIDNAGTHGDVFARDITQDAMIAGHAAILVEYPKTGGRQNALEEQALKPYWIPIRKDNILSWRTETIDGRIILTQIVLRECVMVADGEFGEAEQEQYRVFYRRDGIVGFRLLVINKNNVVVEIDSGLYPTQEEIPIAEIVTSGKKSMFESQPPLLDLANLNIAHYQILSDYLNCIHKTNVPVWVQIGAETQYNDDGTPKKVIIGPNTGLSLPIGGDAKWVAHNGEALGETRLSISDITAYMATVGMSMLSPDKRTAETAEGKRIDKSGSDSKLGVTARGAQDGFERAAGFHIRYYRIDGGVSIEVNRDFENLKLTAQDILALSALVREGQLDLETLWDMLAEGNILPGTFDKMLVKARIDAQKAIDDANAIEKQKQLAEINAPMKEAA